MVTAASLRRSLSALDLVFAGVGATLGTGIFVITGHAAAAHAGPSIVVSFAIAGVACACTALCYAELASVVPESGGAYSYVTALFGRLPGWWAFWCILLEYELAVAVVAVGFSGYLAGLMSSFGLPMPTYLSRAPFAFVHGSWTGTGAVLNLPAVISICAVTVVLCCGIRPSAGVNRLLVAVKISVITLFIVVGLGYVQPTHWHPFLPANTGEWGTFGWSGTLAAAAIVFSSYLGFDVVATLAQESRNPQRGVPIGIIGSLSVCAVLYMLAAITITGLVPYAQLDVPNPLYLAVAVVGPKLAWMGAAINIGALLGMISVMLVVLLAMSRTIYSVANNGLVPKALARLSRRGGVPTRSIVAVGGCAAALAALCPIDVLAKLISLGTLLVLATVCVGVVVLRLRNGDAGGFQTPWFPSVPLLGFAACVLMMVAITWDAWVRLLFWIAAGTALYVCTQGWKQGVHRELRHFHLGPLTPANPVHCERGEIK
jgi:basic amino acid/polyamine antiporter, APA family